MRMIVCIKPVPDPRHWDRLKLDPRTKTLVREGIPAVLNPLDKKALEAALQLKEKTGGEIQTLSMAPPESIPLLREALAMGADGSVLLSDRAFAGSDSLATAYILAAAIKKMGPYDLILCGDQTLDGSTGQVSAQIAEFLGIPNLMHVSAVERVEDGSLHVRSLIERGFFKAAVRPPVVLAVAKEINEPRYITFLNILESEQKEIRTWSAEDLSLEEGWVGLTGSPSQMAGVRMPERKKKAELLQGRPQEMAEALAERLHRLGYC